jgi:4'-phosphopantetheinyl transferase
MPLISLNELEGDGLVGLWRITEPLEELAPYTNKDQYLQAIREEARKQASVAARMLVRQMLHHWQEAYHGIDKKENGEPVLIGHPHFLSLTHSGPYAAAMVHKSRRCGIDLEEITDRLQQIGPRVFAQAELESCAQDSRKLTIIWSAKESLYKMYGRRQLSFREHLFVRLPLSEGDELEGRILAPDGELTCRLFLQQIGTFILTFGYTNP